MSVSRTLERYDMWNALNTFEIGILDFIQQTFKCGFLDVFMPFITMFGEDGIFFIALAAVLLFPKKTRKVGLCIGAALLMGFIVGNLTLKPIFARMRPYDFNEAFDKASLLVGSLGDKSFPSGHTLAAFEACVVLFLTQKRYIGIPALMLSFLIALSRLYLYVHYPTDVLVGALLGTLFAVLGVKTVNFAWSKIEQRNAKTE